MWNKVRAFFELIKFEHTVFALPFAYLGTLLALGGRFEAGKFMWVTLAMVGARTAGMTLNRIVDLSIDRDNPRTKNRPLLTGALSMRAAWIAAAAGCGLLFLSAWMLNPLCLKLSPIAVFLLSTYHYVKRFSALCHFALGLVLAVAPMGGWIAVTGSFSWLPVPLALAVLFWVAGFDIIYSLQDMDFDRTHGLHSVPAKFGQKTALIFARCCHIATVSFLVLFGILMQLGALYWIGASATAGLLFFEHKLLEDADLNRINTAFFTINGWVGILLFIFTFLDTFR